MLQDCSQAGTHRGQSSVTASHRRFATLPSTATCTTPNATNPVLQTQRRMHAKYKPYWTGMV